MLYQSYLKNKIKEIINSLIKNKILQSQGFNINRFSIEVPQHQKHGDVSINFAMVYAKTFSMKPQDLASHLSKELNKLNEIKKIEILGPGFINIFFYKDFWNTQLNDLLKNINNYKYGIKKKKFVLNLYPQIQLV